MKRLLISLLACSTLLGCESDTPEVRGIFSSRISHHIFDGYRLSIHSRVKFSDDQFMEIRSYRIKHNDGTSHTDQDIGVMTLAGELTRQSGQLTVALNQVKMEMDADLYRRFVSQPRPELAMVDVPALVRRGKLQFEVLQYDQDTLCLDRIGGHPQCYLLSQVVNR